MVLSVYSLVPMTKLSPEYNLSKEYLRVFKNAKSSQFLQLIEQLAILKFMNFWKKSISQQIEALDLLFSCLISKLKAGLSPHLTMSIFYKKISISLEGLYKLINNLKKIINSEGWILIFKDELQKKILTKRNNKRFKELVDKEDEFQQYGFINYSGQIEYGELDIYIILKTYSICLIEKVDLANKIFCRHRYCEYCLQIYFRNKYSIVCLILGCNAKLFRRLITLKNQMKQIKALLNRKQNKIQQAEPNAATLQMDLNWPPKFENIFQNQLFRILIYSIKKNN